MVSALRGNINVIKSALKVASHSNKRLLWKFITNFALKSISNINRFDKRVAHGDPFFPAFMMISLTNACNLRCSGCWVAQTNPHQQLSFAQLDGIIEASKRNGAYFFGILGGEPLLYPRLFEIFEKHKDCYFQLFTNGTLLTEEKAMMIKKVGNVTPLISIEGMEEQSDIRRGKENVFHRTIAGVENCTRLGIITGAAASICKGNINELLTRRYLDYLASKNVSYLWYYIYRPVGENPNISNALSEDEIVRFRRFIVEERQTSPVMIIETYWDAEGKALCPGATGLSHHVGPNGAVEFCPPIQIAREFLNDDASNLQDIFNNSRFLNDLRKLTADHSRGCILMDDPELLRKFALESDAIDSNCKEKFLRELDNMKVVAGHNMPGGEIPEINGIYRLIKKNYFFGFGAYG